MGDFRHVHKAQTEREREMGLLRDLPTGEELLSVIRLNILEMRPPCFLLRMEVNEISLKVKFTVVIPSSQTGKPSSLCTAWFSAELTGQEDHQDTIIKIQVENKVAEARWWPMGGRQWDSFRRSPPGGCSLIECLDGEGGLGKGGV